MDQASTIGYKLGYDPLIIITDRKEKARMMQGNRTSHWYKGRRPSMVWILIIGIVCISFSILSYVLCKVSDEADRRAGYDE